jgi:predicted amidohydrolase
MSPTPKHRLLTVAAAQLGPVPSLDTPRPETLARMVKLLEEAAEKKVRLVVYPEIAFTTFFPSYIIEDPHKVAAFFEPASPSNPYAIIQSPNVKPLIDKADELGIDISFGYAERWRDEDGKTTDYNTAVYYSSTWRQCIAKYRKVHLPGRYEPDTRPGVTQQLEKRYFTPGDLGFQAFRVEGLIEGTLKSENAESVHGPIKETEGLGDPILGMLICNDRRWAEGWRCYGLQGIELLVVSCIFQDPTSVTRPHELTTGRRRDITPQPLPRNTKEQTLSKKKKLSSTTAYHAKREATRTRVTAFMRLKRARKITDR